MKSKTSEWYEVAFRYEKTLEDGSEKTVTEQYVVEALSFTEAEQRILKELGQYVRGEYYVKAIKKAVYKEVFFENDKKEEKWFKTKLQFITIDEKTGKEKRFNVIYLVQSNSLIAVCKAIDKIMVDSVHDYESVSIQATKIVEVYPHE